MWYKIPGNQHFLIKQDEDDKIYLKNVELKEDKILNYYSVPEINNGYVNITLYNITKRVSLEWLYNIAYYQLEFPKGYEDNIFKIRFYLKTKSSDATSIDINENDVIFITKHIIIFDTPCEIEHKGKIYRIIPKFPKYAISPIGETLNLETYKTNMPNIIPGFKNIHYPSVSIIHPTSTRTSVAAHSLIGITWLENSDWNTRIVIDHKDGDKGNCYYKNLRWVTVTENNIYSFNQNDTEFKKRDKVIIRNIDTGETKKFDYLQNIANYTGYAKLMYYKDRRFLANSTGRYEVKSLLTHEPDGWLSLESVNKIDMGIKTYQIEIRTHNEVFFISDLATLNILVKTKKFTDDIPKLLDIYKAYNPTHVVIYKHITVTTPLNIYAKNFKTGKICYNITLKTFSRRFKIPFCNIQRSYSTNGGYEYDNWRIKPDDGTPFSPLIKIFNTAKVYEIIDTSGRFKNKILSQRGVSSLLSIPKYKIRNMNFTKPKKIKQYIIKMHNSEKS